MKYQSKRGKKRPEKFVSLKRERERRVRERLEKFNQN